MKELTNILSEGLIGSRNRNLGSVGEFFERIAGIMTSVQTNQVQVRGAIEELYNFLCEAPGVIIRDGYIYDMSKKEWKDEVLIGFLTKSWLGKRNGRIPVDNEIAYFVMPSEDIYDILDAGQFPEIKNITPGRMGIFVGPKNEKGGRNIIRTAMIEEATCVFCIPKNHPLRREVENICREINSAAI